MSTIEEGLLDYTKRAMYIYGTHTNEDRALPDYRDGMKPTHRRHLWALKFMPAGLIKSARLVGDTLGKFHPHGDNACYGAVVTMVQSPQPMIIGSGNWGSMMDNPAAMRYTELRVSKYGETFIRPDYIAVADFTPNYEDKELEPVILPALLPNILLNGTQGIGVGTTSFVPSYTLKSVLDLMIRRLSGEKLEIKDYVDGLVFNFPWGGQLVKSKENKKALSEFYKTGVATVKFTCHLVVDEDRHRITVDDFAPGISMTRDKVRVLREMPGVTSVQNTTNKKDKNVSFRIGLEKRLKGEALSKVVKKIQDRMTAASSFKVNLTERTKTATGVEVRLFSTNVPELVDMWLKWRVDLEVKSLDYRIQKQKEQIAHTKLMLFAISKLPIIFLSLKEKDPDRYLVKRLKITDAQAKTILDGAVRRLARLDKEKLEERLKVEKVVLKQLELQWSKPSKQVKEFFGNILERAK